MIQKALEIRSRFLVRGAPLETNLPHSIITEIERRFASVLPPDAPRVAAAPSSRRSSAAGLTVTAASTSPTAATSVPLSPAPIAVTIHTTIPIMSRSPRNPQLPPLNSPTTASHPPQPRTHRHTPSHSNFPFDASSPHAQSESKRALIDPPTAEPGAGPLTPMASSPKHTADQSWRRPNGIDRELFLAAEKEICALSKSSARLLLLLCGSGV
jgi:hypothetical protein